MQTSSVLLLALLAIFSCVTAEFVTTVYTARLSSTYVVPVTGPEGNYGTAVCSYYRNLDPKLVDCEVQHNLNLALGPYEAKVKRGRAGEIGIEVFSFASATDNHLRQFYQMDDITTDVGGHYSIIDQEEDFLNGRWYIEVTSQSYPEGVIRGNLLHSDRAYARLSGSNVVPPQNSASSGIALGAWTEYQPRRQMTFDITHSVAEPTGIFVRWAEVGDNGPVELELSSWTSPVQQVKTQYSFAMENHFQVDEQYLTVESTEYTNGEIRGQLYPIDYLPPASYTARLDGYSVKPSVSTTGRGCAIFSLNCKTKALEFLVFHSLTFATRVEIHSGAGGANGPVRHVLPRAQSPIYGSVDLTDQDISLLFRENLYLVVITPSHPEGEIRGQISQHYDYYAYLSGTTVLPPRTTSAVGCATFRLAEKHQLGGTVLDYEILHDVADAVAVEMHFGGDGQVGSTDFAYKKAESPISGFEDVLLNDYEVQEFTYGRMFTLVRSERFNDEDAGELRGQIIHLMDDPCPDLDTNSFTSYQNSDFFTRVDPPPDWSLPPKAGAASLGVQVPLMVAVVLFGFLARAFF